MDYALAHALKGKEGLPGIDLLYDIACQYGINILKRFEERWPELAPVASLIRMLVPKMHLALGHEEDCQYRFSLNYMRNCGRTTGEIIETLWAPAKKAGATTREMNAGHRHETLDAYHGNWNWRKTQHQGM